MIFLRRVKVHLLPWLVPLLVVAGWQWGVTAGGVSSQKVPAPSAVVALAEPLVASSGFPLGKALRQPLLRARTVSKQFDGRTVLAGIDLDPGPGEIVAIVGRSGCGKSTRRRLLAGLERVSGGNIALAGQQLTGLNHAARLMFQDACLLPWKTVLQNVVLAAPTRLEMQALIETLRQEQRFGALLITHDVEEAVALADRVLVMEEGRFTLDLAVDLPRPRLRSHGGFIALRERVLAPLLARRTH